MNPPRTVLLLLIFFIACRQTQMPTSLSAPERVALYKTLKERLDKCGAFRKEKGRLAALPLYEQLLTDATKQLGNRDSTVAELNGKLANQYFFLYRYRDALQSYRQAVEIWRTTDAQRYAGSIATFETYIGNTLIQMGQSSEGEIYYNQAIPYFISRHDTMQLIEIYNLLGLSAFENHTFVNSVTHFQTGLALKPNESDRAMLSHNIGRSYRELGSENLHLSLNYLQKAVRFYNKTDSGNAARSFVELAQTQLKLKDYKSATASALQSLNLRAIVMPSEMPESYRVLGEIEAQQGAWANALAFYQNDLKVLVPNFSDDDVLKNSVVDVSDFDRKVELVEVLSLKIDALNILYQQTGNRAYLEAALSTTVFADALMQQLRHEMLDEVSKFFWNVTALPLYEKGIRAADELFNITHQDSFRLLAFNFCRRTKAPVLTDALHENRIKNFAGVPDAVLQRERDLKTQIASAQKEVIDNANVPALKQKLNESRRQLNELQDTLHRQYARYYRIAYESPLPGITELQNNLTDSTLAVEYFLGKDTIYMYAWTKHNGFQSFKSPRPLDFDTRFDHLLRSLRDQDLIQDKSDSSQYANQWFCDNAFVFYELLLKQPLSYFNKNQSIKRLRIIPDGKLAFLPFDVLTDKSITNWHRRIDVWHNYIIARFAVSYVYNDEEIVTPSIHKRFSPTFGGFSVSYQNKSLGHTDSLPLSNGGRDFMDDKKKLHPLPYAKQEVATISLLFGNSGQIWNEARKSDFMNHATQCGIIHLSLHGYMDEDEPMRSSLIFAHRDSTDTDYFLSTSEIYGMQFSNTGLAILSACNTGNGKLVRGEGIMSMARAFEMAGCPSTIVSLWSIPDSSTATIMARFHEYQAQGIPKDISLQQAKIDYLSRNQTGQFCLPNYWAATAVIGDVTPVICGGTDYSIYWLAGLLLLAILVIFIRKNVMF